MNEKCVEQLKKFNDVCPNYWVKHFIRSYRIERFKAAQKVVQDAANTDSQGLVKLFDDVENKK